MIGLNPGYLLKSFLLYRNQKNSLKIIYFQGFSKSHLYWNDTTNYWVLKDNKNSSIYAIQNETHNEYPFGVKKWYVFNDIDCINQENKMSENVYATKISLNNFNENLFNCLDGTRYVLELIKNTTFTGPTFTC